MLLSNPLKLPRLPIPALGATMQRWLDSVRPHAEGDAGKWEHAQKIAKEFEHGEGAELHRRLVERDASDAAFQGGGHYPHSYIERCWDDMYLEGRWALPINSNPVLVLQPPPKGYSPIDSDPQIATAAAFISSHVKYPSSVTSGAFEVDPGICAYQHALQVGTGRIAQQDRDRVTSHPSSRHIVVIANDRMYDLDVLSPPGKDGTRTHLSPKALARELSRIRAAAKAAGPPKTSVGYLTAVDRNEWANARAILEASGGDNMRSLKTIDSALCVLALEDVPPAKADDVLSDAAARVFLLGEAGRNRWFDKHQLCVLPSGAAAVNFEHSYSDGMAWCRNLGEVWHDIYGVPSKNVRTLAEVPTHDTHPQAKELTWKLSNHVEQAAEAARQSYLKDCAGLGLKVLDFTSFGKGAFKGWKVSPDAGVQMALQTAFYALHGHLPAVYESASTNRFFHGRTETIRSATSESLKLVKALQASSGAGKAERRELLVAAANKHVEVAKAAVAGNGVDRHLAAMKHLAAELAEGGPVMGSQFYADPLYRRSCTWELSTSNVSNPFLSSFSFGPVTGTGYGIGYLIHVRPW
eukprot:TRINITY_DN5571_c0_g5_i2.p1 TRINITY_DN5571_c0_g5~~TRINITY_DN5571_c0_g5_i2.p1  ORF type:complete len:610 (+),score=168.31 TRINITY_DN5571_c0_g5_i2:92-1831(+)